MPRVPEVTTTPLVDRLSDPGAEIEDVVALVGFVGVADDPDNFIRLHPSPDLQAWMDFPKADVYNSALVDPAQPEGPTIVWMFREPLQTSQVFSERAAAALQGEFEDPEAKMTVWQLLPSSRYVAAELLGLIDRGEGRY